MAQHIGLIKINENGEKIEGSTVNFAGINNYLTRLTDSKKEFPWLSTIDPYGDTYLNRYQLPIFKEELINLRHRITDQILLQDIEDIITFIDTSGTHQYIKFIGD